MLTVPAFVAPPPGPVTVALICSLLGSEMTAARVLAARVGVGAARRADQPWRPAR
jgi:hypothetical protein